MLLRRLLVILVAIAAPLGATRACITRSDEIHRDDRYAFALDASVDATTPPTGAGGSDLLSCASFSKCADAGVMYYADDVVLPYQPSPYQDAGWIQEAFVIGDSITGGYAASYAYPFIAQTRLGQGTLVRSVAKPGQTCLQVGQQAVYDASAAVPTPGVTGRHVAVLMCGANNQKDAVDADPSGVVGEQRDIVTYLHDAGFSPVMVMITPQWTGFTPSNWKPMHDALIDAAATGADRIITLDGTPLVLIQDAGDSTWINMDQINDRLHPTNDGQTLMGNILAKELLR